MDSLQFALPWWLAAGALAGGGLFFAYRCFDRKNRADLEKFVSGNPLAQLLSSISSPRRWTRRACFVAATVLVFAALARPQVGHEWREVKRKGIDILFALDASRSMLAEDVSPNRLDRAKLGMIDFVEKLEGDRVGLMPFAGSAFMLCPLTLDYHAFTESLDAIDTEIIPRKGTDLASAIREAGRAFDKAGNNHKILVVITDGEDLQGEALAAAEKAAGQGMTIHTVGIGSAAGELIPIGDDFVRDEDGELVRSKLDADSLQKIAEATGGVYAPFGRGAEGLRQIYAEKLSLIPKGEVAQRMQKVPVDRFHWPLAAAIVLLMVQFLLGERRQVRSGKAPSLATATALATLALISMTDLVNAATDARVTYNEGVQSYQGGDLESAATSFQSAIENTADLSLQARAYYNLGNTIFKTGAAKLGEQSPAAEVIEDWRRSLEAFEGTLALDPADGDARFNRDLVQRKIEELKKQQEQEQQDQQPQEQQGQDQQENEKQQQADGEQEPEDKQESASESEGDDPEEQPGDQSEQSPTDSQPEEGEEQDQEPSSDPSDAAEDQQQPSKEGGDERENRGDDKAAGSGEQAEENPAEEHGESPETPQPAGEGEPGQVEGAEAGEQQDQANPDQQATGVPSDERRNPGEMSREEARQLLQALENDEERVLLVPARRGDPRSPNNTTKGKDW